MAAVLTSPFTAATASARHAALGEVLGHPGVWRRGHAPAPSLRTQPTGDARLDARLPGGGWPRGALTEILVEHDGLAELRLLRRRSPPPARRRGDDCALCALPGSRRRRCRPSRADRCRHRRPPLEPNSAGARCAAVLHWLPEVDTASCVACNSRPKPGCAGLPLRPAWARHEATRPLFVSMFRLGKLRGNPQVPWRHGFRPFQRTPAADPQPPPRVLIPSTRSGEAARRRRKSRVPSKVLRLRRCAPAPRKNGE